MKKVIYKSKIQCPDCEGCGRMAVHCVKQDGSRGINSYDCTLCNGKGVITGNIKIEFNDLN